MLTTRNILRGTSRLSLVVAVLAAGYSLYTQWTEFSESQSKNLELVSTLECGARLSELTLKPAANQFGNFDLGKTGCSTRQLWASSDELLQARSGALRRDWMATEFSVRHAGANALMHAVMAMVLVNLLGLAFVGFRAVFGWIASGFRSAS